MEKTVKVRVVYDEWTDVPYIYEGPSFGMKSLPTVEVKRYQRACARFQDAIDRFNEVVNNHAEEVDE